MVGGDSTGPGLQLVGARFSNFLPRKLSLQFQRRPVSIFHDIQTAIFPYCDATVTWLDTLVVLHAMCTLI